MIFSWWRATASSLLSPTRIMSINCLAFGKRTPMEPTPTLILKPLYDVHATPVTSSAKHSFAGMIAAGAPMPSVRAPTRKFGQMRQGCLDVLMAIGISGPR